MSQTVCEFCRKESEGEDFARLKVGQNSFDFCSWSCIFAYALSQLKTLENQQTASIAELKAKVEELDYVVAHVRARVGI